MMPPSVVVSMGIAAVVTTITFAVSNRVSVDIRVHQLMPAGRGVNVAIVGSGRVTKAEVEVSGIA